MELVNNSDKWEGCIKEVRDGSFIAHLKWIGEEGSEESEGEIEGEFGFDMVLEEDRGYVKKGVVFRWDEGNKISISKSLIVLWDNFDVEFEGEISEEKG